jgi:Type ISP C-terminal specificity domain
LTPGTHLRRRGNLGLLALRQSTAQTGAFVTRCVAGHKVVSSYAPNTVFPLFLYDETGQAVPNLDPAILRRFADRLQREPAPEDLFGYVYAVLQDPRYLARFREPLRTGFPRIPLPESLEAYQRGAALGRELASVHLLEDPRLASSPVFLDGDPSQPLAINPAALAYDGSTGRVRLNRQDLAFEGIAPDVWGYQLGSYRVLERWLRARAGQPLNLYALREFRWIAEAVRLGLGIQQRIQEIG